MKSIKEIVQIAFNYFDELYAGEFKDLSLEEVELASDEKTWSITLGYNIEKKSPLPFGTTETFRKYKILKIDAESGKVWSMKIRSV